jgi:hypothetical protein
MLLDFEVFIDDSDSIKAYPDVDKIKIQSGCHTLSRQINFKG